MSAGVLLAEVEPTEMTREQPSRALERGAPYRAWLRGRKVAVVGLARSGVAACRLLRACGAAVTAVDAKPLTQLGDEVRGLEALGVRLVAGAPSSAALAGAELIVVSPGVPLDAAILAARTAPVIGELELAWRAMESDAIAITGTNGKTTTTALCGSLLQRQPRPVLVAGNIGTPLAGEALVFPPEGIAVLEVSSFQLETIERFRPRVAAVLNVTPDHLDRHRSLDAYVAAKARILKNQTPHDRAVLNWDDPITRALAERTAAVIVPFSRRAALDHGVFVRDERIVASLPDRTLEICRVDEIPLRGRHNVENVLAATACALWTGMAPEQIRRGIVAFRGVPHRIEAVRELGGVTFYNDSKGTNVDSTLRALDSFGQPIVLIAGGLGKGQDFTPLATAARGRVRSVVLIGTAAPEIAASLRVAGIPTVTAGSLADALHAARSAARPGDVVLLSPACASFDMFQNFEHRGDVFRALVQAIPE